MTIRAGELETLARLERPIGDDSFRGAGSGTWAIVDDSVWIGVRDQLPSRSEQPASGMPMKVRRSRVRMYWRDDIEPEMRLVAGNRVMQIVAGPAELGRRSGLELMVEEYFPAGNPA